MDESLAEQRGEIRRELRDVEHALSEAMGEKNQNEIITLQAAQMELNARLSILKSQNTLA